MYFFIASLVTGLVILLAYHVFGYDLSRRGTEQQRTKTAILTFLLWILVPLGLALYWVAVS